MTIPCGRRDQMFIRPETPVASETRGVGRFSRIIAGLCDRMVVWRARRQLSTLSDAMLKDIGISRAEIDHAALHGRQRFRIQR